MCDVTSVFGGTNCYLLSFALFLFSEAMGDEKCSWNESLRFLIVLVVQAIGLAEQVVNISW